MKAMFFGNTMLSDHVLEKNARALVTNQSPRLGFSWYLLFIYAGMMPSISVRTEIVVVVVVFCLLHVLLISMIIDPVFDVSGRGLEKVKFLSAETLSCTLQMVTMCGPTVISWFINPSNYSYKYHKP